jgi:hypothetical protein
VRCSFCIALRGLPMQGAGLGFDLAGASVCGDDFGLGAWLAIFPMELDGAQQVWSLSSILVSIRQVGR